MSLIEIHSDAAPKALGPYSQAIASGGYVFLSGMLGLDPEDGQLAQGIEAQSERAMQNIRALLASRGLGMERIVKTTVYLRDMGDFAAFNAVYASQLSPPYPARSCVAVAGLPKGALVEVEIIAALSD